MTIKRMYHMIRISLMKNGFRRAEYLKKKDIFAYIGENCFWHPRNIPPESKLIKLHNNVVIASDVLFVNHDVMHYMFKHMENEKLSDTDTNSNLTGHFRMELGAIDIGNNVFIGSRCTILPGAKIDDNVIFGAGSLISGKFYEGGGIYAGVPAKRIGNFDNLMKKRELESEDFRSKIDRFEETWDEFYQRYPPKGES